MIKINGIIIPTPSGYVPGIQDLSQAERNANGTMIIERIATKRKLEIGYNFLSMADAATVLQSVSGVLFTVEYPDPEDGAMRSGTFYCGDRSIGALDYKDGVMRWKDLKFNLIER